MNIKDILAKVAKGEELTDAEKSELSNYDPQKAIDAAAAAARKDAEKKSADLQKKVDELTNKQTELEKKLKDKAGENMSENEKLQQTIQTLSEKLAGVEKQLTESAKEKAQLKRQTTIESIRQKSGVKFIQGVSESIMQGAFANMFDGLTDEQLADENVVKPIIEKFKTENAAAIAAPDQFGSGNPPNVGGSGTSFTGKNPYKEDSFDLSKQIELEKNNPAEAKRLAAEAGVE